MNIVTNRISRLRTRKIATRLSTERRGYEFGIHPAVALGQGVRRNIGNPYTIGTWLPTSCSVTMPDSSIYLVKEDGVSIFNLYVKFCFLVPLNSV